MLLSMSRRVSPLAGFQVTIIGRFWVTTEVATYRKVTYECVHPRKATSHAYQNPVISGVWMREALQEFGDQNDQVATWFHNIKDVMLYYPPRFGRLGFIMAGRRVALIGHSGAGKTACLQELGLDRALADMDKALGLHPCAPGNAALMALDKALRWLTAGATPMVVTVCNVEEMLKVMKDAKLNGKRSEEFGCIVLVYLHNPREELREHLARPTADGVTREADGVEYTINNYARLHTLYSKLADRIVDCSGMTIERVAEEVAEIVSHSNGKNV